MRNAVNQKRHLSGMLLALSISSALVALTDMAAAGPIGHAVGGVTGGVELGRGSAAPSAAVGLEADSAAADWRRHWRRTWRPSVVPR